MIGLAKSAFELPTIDLVLPENQRAIREKPVLAAFAVDLIELKVLTNALTLLSTTDSHTDACNKVAECVADAAGLGISFACFGL